MLILALFSIFLISKGQLPDPCNPVGKGCSPDLAECFWWGDPHHNTFDGLYHAFQGTPTGTYRHVSPCFSDFTILPFQVLSTNIQCQTLVTCTDALILRLYDASGSFVRQLDVDYVSGAFSVIDSVFGVLPSFPFSQLYDPGRRYIVKNSPGQLEISVYTGVCNAPDIRIVASDEFREVFVYLNYYYYEKSCGLCGFFSGTSTDDLVEFPASPTCAAVVWTLPPDMGSYLPPDWAVINSFGSSWQDMGPNLRRLEEQENPTVDPVCSDLAKQVIQQLYPEASEAYLNQCSAEVCIRCEHTDPVSLEICILDLCPEGGSFDPPQ